MKLISNEVGMFDITALVVLLSLLEGLMEVL